MPIFDNPDRELSRLERQLAEEEQELEDLVAEYGDGDYDDCFREDYEEETREPRYRRQGDSRGADVRNFAEGYRGEDLFEEEDDFEDVLDAKRHRRRSGRGLIAVVIFFALAYYVTRRLGLW